MMAAGQGDDPRDTRFKVWTEHRLYLLNSSDLPRLFTRSRETSSGTGQPAAGSSVVQMIEPMEAAAGIEPTEPGSEPGAKTS